jgi:hypothetical protein
VEYSRKNARAGLTSTPGYALTTLMAVFAKVRPTLGKHTVSDIPERPSTSSQCSIRSLLQSVRGSIPTNPTMSWSSVRR